MPASGSSTVDSPPAGARQIDAAYVVHTSGSTGTPKAVAVPAAALASAVAATADAYGLSADDRVLQFSNPAFDVFLEEVLGALARGAALVLPKAAVPTGHELAALLLGRAVTVANLPTSYVRGVLDEMDGALAGR